MNPKKGTVEDVLSDYMSIELSIYSLTDSFEDELRKRDSKIKMLEAMLQKQVCIWEH